MTLNSGHNPHEHKVLIVGHKVPKDQAMGPVLDNLSIQFVHDDTGEKGIETLKETAHPFSIVVCDQRMPGMRGSQFLAKVKEISPETIRILITGYSEMEAIIQAVNTGAVQYYISKPWNNETMTEAIRSGIAHYEKHLESQQLFVIAKKQNTKLYELNCELMENAKANEKQLNHLEKEIIGLAAKLKRKNAQRPLTQSLAIDLILKYLKTSEKDSQEKFNTLYGETIQAMYLDFSELALRNGIEMPEPVTKREAHD